MIQNPFRAYLRVAGSSPIFRNCSLLIEASAICVLDEEPTVDMDGGLDMFLSEDLLWLVAVGCAFACSSSLSSSISSIITPVEVCSIKVESLLGILIYFSFCVF
jgi:hypothetical protein